MSTRRTQSARSRKVNRKEFSYSRYGYIEPITHKITMVLSSGRTVFTEEVKDYSCVSILYCLATSYLLIPCTRLSICYKGRILSHGDDREPIPDIFKTFLGERECTVTVMIQQFEACPKCKAESPYSGWINRINGLPEYQRYPKCECEYDTDTEAFHNCEWGWRGIRLWKHLMLSILERMRQTKASTKILRSMGTDHEAKVTEA